jgi:endonuclease/exonuclease/phosphatase family metal-dependent hydrolase
MIVATVRAPADAEGGRTMRVLTWNLWWRYGPWQRRREAIVATLAEAGPDVCGLQEVWQADEENLAGTLAAELGLHWSWAAAGRHRDSDGHEVLIGNAILSRWPITAQAELRLPTGDIAGGRVALHARIAAPGGVLPMFTTHLSYQPGASRVRTEQVRQLAGFMAVHGTDGDYPPVVTGDLNAEPDSDELRLLGGLLTAPAVPGLVLVDAWRYADPGDPGFSWDRRNGYQANSVLPDSRIDYILVGLPRRGRGRVESTQLAGNAPVDGVWPSDHFAVVADLE